MSNSEYFPTEGEAAAPSLSQGKRKNSGPASRRVDTADRLPPHSIEAEQGVLGCVFLAPHECMSECVEAGLRPETFYDLRHQVIWTCLAAMYDGGKAVDVITVQQWLKDRGELESVGGIAFLATLPDTVPSAANLSYYVNIVREKAKLRRLLALCAETTSQVFACDGEIDPLLAQFEKEALALSADQAQGGFRPVKDYVLELIDGVEKDYHRGSAQIKGIRTGLSYLDKLLGGLGGRMSRYIALAARPGDGKTSLALNLVAHAALSHEWFTAQTPAEFAQKQRPVPPGGLLPEGYLWSKDDTVIFQKHVGVPCAFFSLEMTGLQLVERMVFQHSKSDLQRFRTGFAGLEDIARLGPSAAKLAQAGIYVDDTGRLTIDTLKARARQAVRQWGVKMFVVDYVQLIKSHRSRHQRPDRVSELEEISAEIQQLGKELDVPFVLLGQLNRDVTKSDRWRKPQASDIKSCGAIEQDADQIILLYRPKMDEEERNEWDEQVRAAQAQDIMRAHPRYTREELTAALAREDWSKRLRCVNALVDKNRYGRTGDAELVFDGACTDFEDRGDWLKRRGLKAPAAGESKRKEQPADDFADGNENFPEV